MFDSTVSTVEIGVHGVPAPQVSKWAFLSSLIIVKPYPRVVRCPSCRVPVRGAFSIVEKSKGLKAWRKAVAQHAGHAMGGRELLHGAPGAYVDFAVARPNSHYRIRKVAHLT